MRFLGAPNNFRFPETKKTELLLMPIRVVHIFGDKEIAEAKRLDNEYVTEDKNENANRRLH